MFSSRGFPLLFLALSFFISIVSGQAIGDKQVIENFAENENYTAIVQLVTLDPPVYSYTVSSTGYNGKAKADTKGGYAVNIIYINTQHRIVSVAKAMNGLDKSNPRLIMRDIILECWLHAGLAPLDLNQIAGLEVENKEVKDALAKCRSVLRLGPEASFEMLEEDTEWDDDLADCWAEIELTVFGSSVQGAIAEFVQSKKMVVKVQVTHNFKTNPWTKAGASDNIYWTLG